METKEGSHLSFLRICQNFICIVDLKHLFKRGVTKKVSFSLFESVLQMPPSPRESHSGRVGLDGSSRLSSCKPCVLKKAASNELQPKEVKRNSTLIGSGILGQVKLLVEIRSHEGSEYKVNRSYLIQVTFIFECSGVA